MAHVFILSPFLTDKYNDDTLVELLFKGFGDCLKNIKYIICEVDYQPLYSGESVFDEIKEFMTQKGFKCYFHGDNTNYFGDVLFVNQNLWLP